MRNKRRSDISDRSYKIYVLAVCFAALICAAITTGVVLYNLVKIAAPELTLDSHSYNAHQSIDAFRRSAFHANGRPGPLLVASGQFMPGRGAPLVAVPDTTGDEDQQISDDELENLRVASYEVVLHGHRRGAIQSIIRTCIILFVSLSLFFVHWRLFKKRL